MGLWGLLGRRSRRIGRFIRVDSLLFFGGSSLLLVRVMDYMHYYWH